MLPLFFSLCTFALASTAFAQSPEQRGNASLQSSPSPDYVIGVGDLIRIQVHAEDDLTLQTRLSEKGVISYPFLGEFRVIGYTLSELEDYITRGLKGDYLVNPEVQVVVVEYRPFYVNGQVKRPGGYPFVPGLTVRKAAALAGGFTERASTRKLYVIRESLGSKRIQVELDSTVYPGDTLIIEEGLF